MDYVIVCKLFENLKHTITLSLKIVLYQSITNNNLHKAMTQCGASHLQ